MSKSAPRAASYADKIFSAVLYQFELSAVTDSDVRRHTGLTVAQYAAGKRYLRLVPSARLGFSYTSGSFGFKLTCNAKLIARHNEAVARITRTRLNNALLETERVTG